MTNRRVNLTQIAFIAVVVIVLIGVFFLVNKIGTPEIQLPVLAIMGVVALLAVLTLMSFVFSSLGLSDAREALGLPSGSIRAVIALSLIVIFVISAIFLFAALSFPNETTLTGITANQADNIPVGQLITKAVSAQNPDRFDVTVTVPVGQAGTDFAKQMLTTLGALVTAITSFYFGTQSAQGPRPKPAAPSLSSLSPTSVPAIPAGTTNEIALTIQGDNLLEVTQVLLMQGAQTISASGVTSNMTTINATVELDSSALDYFDVVIKTREGDTTRLTKAFKVEAPAPASASAASG